MPHRWLFEDFVNDKLLEEANFFGSHIYYLVRVPKIRYIAESAKIIKNKVVSVKITIAGNRIIHVLFPLRKLPFFKKINRKDISRMLFEVEPYINKNLSNQYELTVTFCMSKEEHITRILPIDSMIALQEIDVGFKPEIIYIGQSFDMLNRWKNHKQVNRAISTLKDDEELRLYFIHFRFIANCENHGDSRWNALLDISNCNSEVFKDRISIIEQALIQFYRPELNTKHVDGIADTASYQRISEATKIETIGLFLGMHGAAFQFYSQRQRLASEEITLINRNGAIEFIDGVRLPMF
jgi:hypothetical protein